MSFFQHQAEFYDLPIHLSPQQKDAPNEVLADFFVDHRLSQLRDYLYEISEACLTTDEWPFREARKRAELLFYLKKLEIFFEAAFLVSRQYQENISEEKAENL